MSQGPSVYTGPTAADLARIPATLTQRPQWVLWRGVDEVDKKTGELRLTKVPYNARTLRKASTTNARTWSPFQTAVDALAGALATWEQEAPADYRGGGIGFVFSPDDPYCGIDLDHCRDPETGALEPWAQAIVVQVDSYAEASPSDTGVHVLVEGVPPPEDRKKGQVEMYNAGRYFTMTGHHLPNTPATIEARQEAIDAVHAAHLARAAPPRATTSRAAPALDLDDMAILVKANAAKNSALFAALWRGDTSAYKGDDSAADEALCCALAFWTRDPGQMDRLFRGSGLMRDKWEREDYRERTIAKALSTVTTSYDPEDWLDAQIAAKARRNGQSAEPPPADAPRGEPPLPLSDYTNALAFARDHKQDVRHCEAWKKWLIWTGTHWRYDVQGPIYQKAKSTIRRLLQDAAACDDEEYAAWLAHIKRSLSTAALEAMVRSAQNEPGIPIEHTALDQHPHLLACRNATIELKTGDTHRHARADFLTTCLALDYLPKAVCPTWKAFLWRIFGGTPQGAPTDTLSESQLEERRLADERAHSLIAFLQCLCGLCLTGDVSEQHLYVFYGTGANGKSTLLGILLALLGAHGMKAAPELLMASTHHDRHPTERADLFGKRLVAAIETEQGRRLNETLVKELTGGDTIRARRMREDFWEFRPTHKIILATNHKPQIRGTDHAIWRRVKLVPFTVTIPDTEQDPLLPEKLLKELPGILAWCVEGCLDWQEHGLRIPTAVLDATAAYRQEQDVFEDFLSTECVRMPNATCSASALYEAYDVWCKDNDVEPLSKRAFGIRLTECDGLTPEKGTGGRRLWRGVGLPTPPEADTAKERR
jgi:putative DNA primase/helicase